MRALDAITVLAEVIKVEIDFSKRSGCNQGAIRYSLTCSEGEEWGRVTSKYVYTSQRIYKVLYSLRVWDGW